MNNHQKKRISRKISNLFILLISPFLTVIELFLVLRSGRIKSEPAFIIGSPRCGSTILYQALTNQFNFTYIDNLTCRLYRTPVFGCWLSHIKYKNIPHNNFSSSLGVTLEHGLHAPSECGRLWYRWFPKNRHFVETSDITEKDKADLKNTIDNLQSVTGKPVLFKNLNAGQRLRVISEVFPNAKIIFLQRDPRFVAQSILKARESLKIPKGQWWSVKPENYQALSNLDENELCAAQVYYLEKQITEDLLLFPQQNIFRLKYQDMDKGKIEEIGKWIGVKERQGNKMMPEFIKDEMERLKNISQSLKECVDKYNFDKDIFI